MNHPGIKLYALAVALGLGLTFASSPSSAHHIATQHVFVSAAHAPFAAAPLAKPGDTRDAQPKADDSKPSPSPSPDKPAETPWWHWIVVALGGALTSEAVSKWTKNDVIHGLLTALGAVLRWLGHVSTRSTRKQ